MDSLLMKDGSDVSEIDKTVKNKWRWAWLSEMGENGTPFSSWCKKMKRPGVCFCTICHKKMQYGSNGKKVLARHQSDAYHKASFRALQNMSSLPGGTTTTMEVQETMVDHVCNQKVGLCSFRAEHDLSLTIAQPLVNLKKSGAEDAHASYLCTHGNTTQPQIDRKGTRISESTTPSNLASLFFQTSEDMIDHLNTTFRSQLTSTMDLLMKSAVSEITSIFESILSDHQMVVAQKVEEISILQIKLEMAEMKLQEQNGERDPREASAYWEDVTKTSGSSSLIMPETAVEAPDDWCAPLGSETVNDQSVSTSTMDTDSVCQSPIVSLWRLPTIKKVQDGSFALLTTRDTSLCDPTGPYSDEGLQLSLIHTPNQNEPLSVPEGSLPDCRPKVRPTRNPQQPSKQDEPGQPLNVAKEICIKKNRPGTEQGQSTKRKIQAAESDLEHIKQRDDDKSYPYPTGPCLDGLSLKQTQDQNEPLSAPEHRHQDSRPTVRPTQDPQLPSKQDEPGQPLNMAKKRCVKKNRPGTEQGHLTINSKGMKRKIQANESDSEKINKSYRCKFCHKHFGTEFGRSVHLESHKKCTGCQRIFPFPSLLRVHVKSCVELKKIKSSNRGKEKPISPEKNTRGKCNSAFPADVLEGDKEFRCTECHEKFSSLLRLHDHTCLHSDRKLSACTKCAEKFNGKHSLKMHMFEVHNEEQTAQGDFSWTEPLEFGSEMDANSNPDSVD